MKMRHEIKIPLNTFDRAILRSRLSACMKLDPNAGPDGCYSVRSLYFDTPYDAALREKVSGADTREKFRIRIYNRDIEGPIMLEKKTKHRDLSRKENARITSAECESMIAGETALMSQHEAPLVRELYTKMQSIMLRPKTIVEYKREAFVYNTGNVRITIDSDIRTGLFSNELFKQDLPLVPAADGLIVLEVKYDAFLPGFITDVLRIGSRRQAACSKYTIGRRFG